MLLGLESVAISCVQDVMSSTTGLHIIRLHVALRWLLLAPWCTCERNSTANFSPHRNGHGGSETCWLLLAQVSSLMTLSGSLPAGHAGIGHVRYPTAGSSSAQEAQPFFVNSPLGIYLIHNGNLTNTTSLRASLEGSQSFFNRHLRTDSDSEVCAPLLRRQGGDCSAATCSPHQILGF